MSGCLSKTGKQEWKKITVMVFLSLLSLSAAAAELYPQLVKSELRTAYQQAFTQVFEGNSLISVVIALSIAFAAVDMLRRRKQVQKVKHGQQKNPSYGKG